MTRPSIEVSQLHKSYKRGTEVLRGLDLSVQPGEVYGLIGENGAGKTTLFNCLTGLLAPSFGRTQILGSNFRHASPTQRARTAYVGQYNSGYPNLSLMEHFTYYEKCFPKWNAKQADYLARKFDLPLFHSFKYMSGGMQRKAAIVLSIASQAEVLLLDEPAANLDPLTRRTFVSELADILAERENLSVLLSTHILSDLERVASTLGMLQNGKISYQANLIELSECVRKVQVIFPKGTNPPADFTLPGQIGSLTINGSILTGTAKFDSLDQLDSYARRTDVQVGLFPMNLEDLFIELTQLRKAS